MLGNWAIRKGKEEGDEEESRRNRKKKTYLSDALSPVLDASYLLHISCILSIWFAPLTNVYIPPTTNGGHVTPKK